MTHAKIELLNSAIVVIDIQNDFVLPDAPAELPGASVAVDNIKTLLEIFRKKNLQIIHIVRLYRADGSNAERCRRNIISKGHTIVLPKSQGSQIPLVILPRKDIQLDDELLLNGYVQTIGEREWIMYKPRWGAFYMTPLENTLNQQQVDTVIICGCHFPHCIRTTLYEASERDLSSSADKGCNIGRL